MRDKNAAWYTIFVMGWALLGYSLPGRAQEQTFKTLELVRTYNSEEALRAAHPELYPEERQIIDDGEFFTFFDADTGKMSKRMKKQASGIVFTEEEQRQLKGSPNVDPVVKETVGYMLSEKRQFLMVMEMSIIFNGLGDYERESELKKHILYDHEGVELTHLPLDFLGIQESPNLQYFLAYSLEERSITHNLYFYSRNGTMLNKQSISDYANLSFSQNGEFVTSYNRSGSEFAFFKKTGELLFQGNYTELIPHARSPLTGVFISENGDSMLLVTGRHLYSFTTAGEVLWKKPLSWFNIDSCYVFSRKRKIALKIINKELNQLGTTDRYNLEICSLETGELLDRIIGISEMRGRHEQLVVTKEGTYYEYNID